jgi:hypothetical protein
VGAGGTEPTVAQPDFLTVPGWEAGTLTVAHPPFWGWEDSDVVPLCALEGVIGSEGGTMAGAAARARAATLGIFMPAAAAILRSSFSSRRRSFSFRLSTSSLEVGLAFAFISRRRAL